MSFSSVPFWTSNKFSYRISMNYWYMKQYFATTWHSNYTCVSFWILNLVSMHIRMRDVLLFGGNVQIFRNYRSSSFYKNFGIYVTEKRCLGAHILGDRLINNNRQLQFFSKFFYLFIVGVDSYCCTWSHSMTHTQIKTLGRTPLDEGWAVSRDLYLTINNIQKR
jgi:hypothetical protein